MLDGARHEIVAQRIEDAAVVRPLHPAGLARVEHLGPDAGRVAGPDEAVRGGALPDGAVHAEDGDARGRALQDGAAPEAELLGGHGGADIDDRGAVAPRQRRQLGIIAGAFVQSVDDGHAGGEGLLEAVPYTHLTLPTIYPV